MPIPLAPRAAWQGLSSPVHPGQEEPCPSLDHPRKLAPPAPRQVRRPPVERRELARLLAELGHIGGNLNQLAKAANTGVVTCDGEIEAALGGLAEVRNAILKALGREP